jgi:uncharacterized protein
MDHISRHRILHLLQCCDHPIELEFGTGETMLMFSEFISFVDDLQKERDQRGIKDTVTVTTNGTLLNKEKIDALLDREVLLSFSIDGNREIHELQRFDGQGRTFHERILSNYHYYLRRMAQSRILQDSTSMAVVTENNSLRDIEQFWKSSVNPIYNLSLALPRDCSDPEEMEKYQAIQQQYLRDLEELAFEKAKLLDNPGFLSDFNGPMELFQAWTNLLIGKNKPHSCGIFKYLLAIDAYGDFFPCELLIGRPEMQFGNLERGVDIDKLEALRTLAHPFDNQCSQCEAQKNCPSVCFAERYVLSLTAKDFSFCTFNLQVLDIVRRSYEILSENSQ